MFEDLEDAVRGGFFFFYDCGSVRVEWVISTYCVSFFLGKGSGGEGGEDL